MRWQGRQGSSNVEDRRGGRGGGGFVRSRGGRIGIGGIIIIIIGTLLGGNPLELFQQVQGPPQVQQAPPGGVQSGGADDELAQFVSVVLKETEDTWSRIFLQETGKPYRKPKLVLFERQVRSACGSASSATGPFYCPADEKMYIDLSFYRELRDRFQAPGDFAMAYVIAHEVGHHIQNLLGITDQMQGQRGRISQTQYNELSVRLELQADFLAGVWAHHTARKNLLEEGDFEEAMNAARAIGDDRMQKQAQGYAVPETFTHGTSAQRMRWFRKGYETGDIKQGDTFSARAL
ncbi:MAG: neutral zinc metallopeptidase [Bacteroidota bacterium]